MSDRKSIELVITQAKSLVIQREAAAEQESDLMAKMENKDRRVFLDDLLKEIREREIGRIPGKSIFISYGVKSGKDYFEALRRRLDSAGFEVVTGFQKASGDRGNVLARILYQLKRSTVYLGLLTKETRVSGPHGREQWSPSVWTMEEKGMALALGKPIVLLVQDGIHDDYWLKTAPGKVHLTFTDSNFKEIMKEAEEVVRERYDELIVDSYGRGDVSYFTRNAPDGG